MIEIAALAESAIWPAIGNKDAAWVGRQGFLQNKYYPKGGDFFVKTGGKQSPTQRRPCRPAEHNLPICRPEDFCNAWCYCKRPLEVS